MCCALGLELSARQALSFDSRFWQSLEPSRAHLSTLDMRRENTSCSCRLSTREDVALRSSVDIRQVTIPQSSPWLVRNRISCRARSTCSSCRRWRSSRCTAGASRSASSRSRATCCRSTRARSTRRCTASSSRAGSTREWDASENNRQAKYYRLTRNGRRQLVEERENWARMADAVTRILQTRSSEP